MRRSRFHLTLIALAVAGLLTGAAGLAQTLPTDSWPMFQYTPDHNAVFESPDWNVSWKIDLSKDCALVPDTCYSTVTFIPAEINGGLTIVGGTIYVESYNRRLYAIDALTGNQKWSALMGNIAMNAPLAEHGLVIVGGGGTAITHYYTDATGKLEFGRPQEGDSIYAFNAQTGALAWKYDTRGSNMPTGVLTEEQSPAYVFTNGDFNAHALQPDTGVPRWTVKTPGAGIMSSLTERDGIIFGSTGYGFASPIIAKAFANHDSYVLAHTGWTWAMRQSDGQLIWTSPYGRGFASPVVADGIVFEESAIPASWTDLGIQRSDVAALNAETGALLWHYVGPVGRATTRGTGDDAFGGTYYNGTLYQTLPYGSHFAAFDGRTGRVRWQIATLAPVKMEPVIVDGLLYFGDADGNFYVVRAADGTIEHTIKFPSIFITSPPVVVGHTLFVANGSTLYALRLQDLQNGKLPL